MRPAAMVGRRFICKRVVGFVAWAALVSLMLALAPLLPALAASEQNIKDLQAELDEVNRQIEAQKTRDVTLPELQVEAPREVDATEDLYRIAGHVGDDHENPVIYIDGQVIALTAPGDGAPNLGLYTYAFSYEVAIAGEVENYHIVEAVDAAGNPIAEEVVVRVIATNVPRFRGDYYALIIGNSAYEFLSRVETAADDANALAELLNRRYVFDKERITLLFNASRRDILKSFSEIRRTLKRKDRLLIYYSGHSFLDDFTGAGYWQAQDADEVDDFTWIAVDDVRRNIKGMQAKHVMVVADAVFPLAVSRGTTRKERDRYFDEIDSYASRKMITSGVQTPKATDDGLGEHSVFTDSLLTILEGNQESYITSKQLYDKLARALVGAEGLNPEWGTISDAGDEGSGEFTFILRAKPLVE
jgi:uncharacterized caspase-like protein